MWLFNTEWFDWSVGVARRDEGIRLYLDLSSGIHVFLTTAPDNPGNDMNFADARVVTLLSLR